MLCKCSKMLCVCVRVCMCVTVCMRVSVVLVIVNVYIWMDIDFVYPCMMA